MINDGEITEAVDYWALGVILYELFTEKLPFYTNSVNDICDNIVNLRIDWDLLRNAEYISSEAFDLVNKFILCDKNLRWSSKNMREIKRHKFFDGIDWENIKKTSNLLLKNYVCVKLKKECEMVCEVSNNNDIPIDRFNSKDVDYCSKKVDNLYEKNVALIKSNINIGKKIIGLEFEGLEIKDFIEETVEDCFDKMNTSKYYLFSNKEDIKISS